MKTKYTLTRWFLVAAFLVSLGPADLPAGDACAADDDLVNMLIELVGGSDSDMRILALQQIREEAPGEVPTRRFAELLPKLPPEVQVQLLDALGERGDSAARPGVLKMLNSEHEAVRAMAARSLSGVALPVDIPVLAKVAATGSEPEQMAARHSLRRLPGNAMNAAMTEALGDADTEARIELIGALTDRKVKESMPGIMRSAADSDLAVRFAVLAALRSMADESHVAAIVKGLKSAEGKQERKKAEQALLATCSRGRAKCAAALVAGFEGADAGVRKSMVRSLAEAGGPQSLNKIVALLEDDDTGVSGEAVRVFAGWPDPAAIPHLKQLAGDVENLRNHVLAIRGIVRLAGAGKDRAADFATLAETMKLATRKEEKILVLGALGTIPTSESLARVVSCMDQPALLEDAGFVAVNIAEKIKSADKDETRSAMERVAGSVQSQATKDRARKLLDSL